MARSAPLACIVGVLLALAGCDGRVLRLGSGVPASQVLWIGDSWVLVPGNQVTGVEDLARGAGAIGPNDTYTIAAAAATTMAQIAAQYTSQESTGTKVKVLIMDGGTWDTILSNGSSASITSVAQTFQQLLSTLATDGTVTDVIYFLVPNLSSIPGVATLGPLLLQECMQGAVPCHFIDLQPIWSGHPEYTANGTVPVPTSAGGTAIADAIWATMQSFNIAQ